MTGLVVAWGHPLRGDDAVGWRIAEAVGQRRPGIETVTVHAPVPELAEPVAQADRLVMVDATVELPAGEIGVRRVDPGTRPPDVLLHELSPPALLALARSTAGRAPEAWLVTVGAASFELGAPLGADVAAAVPEAVERVLALLDGRSGPPGGGR